MAVENLLAKLPKAHSSNALPDDASIVDNLREQIDKANQEIQRLIVEKKGVEAALDAREEELIRITRLNIESSQIDFNNLDGMTASGAGGTAGRVDQLLLADQGNKRLIDQLNSQVDFLNEQLAKREAELIKVAADSSKVEGLQLEHRYMLVVF